MKHRIMKQSRRLGPGGMRANELKVFRFTGRGYDCIACKVLDFSLQQALRHEGVTYPQLDVYTV